MALTSRIRSEWRIDDACPGVCAARSRSSAIRKPEASSHNVQDGQGQQNSPAEVHQLVIAEARQRASYPDVETEKTEDLAHEPDEREQRVDPDAVEWPHQIAERAGPSTQKQQRGHATHIDHVAVFSHKEHGELHRAVFGVIAGDELAFRLWQIERRAVGLGEGRDQIDEESNELAPTKDVPGRNAVGGLLVDDVAKIQRAGAKDHTDER